MDRDAGGLAHRHQARHHRVWVVAAEGDDLAVPVRRDAAHVVVDRRQDRDRLLGDIDAGEHLGGLGNARQTLGQHLRIEVVEVQVDVVLLRTDAAAFADLDGHGATDHVAGRQILHAGGVALHEALAFGVGQVAALATGAFGDQAAGAIDAGGMELDEFHVLQRQAGAQGHAAAVAGAGVGRGAGEIGPAIAAGGQHHGLGREPVHRAVVELPGGDAPADAVVHDQVEGEIFDEELDRLAQRLAVHGVQHGVAGAVGRGAGALDRGLAVVTGHAAERPLIDLAFRGAREGHAPMFELIDGRRGVAHEILDGVLVAEPVGTLDGVVHVPAPVVLTHVSKARGDAALSRDGVRPGRKHLGHAGGLQSRLGAAQRRAQARAAGPDDDDIEPVVDDLISHGHSPPRINATFRTQRMVRAMPPQQAKALASNSTVRVM